MMDSEELRKRIAGMQREYMARYGFIGAFPKRFKRLMLLMCAPLPKGIKRRGADLLAENRFAQESRATLVDLEKIKIWDLICGRLKLHELADDRDAMAGSVRQMISILDELCLRVTSVRDPYLMVCISHNLEAFMLPCLPGAGKPNRFRKYSDWDRIRLSYEMFAEAISCISVRSNALRNMKDNAAKWAIFPDRYLEDLVRCLKGNDDKHYREYGRPQFNLLLNVPFLLGVYVGSALSEQLVSKGDPVNGRSDSNVGFLFLVLYSHIRVRCGVMERTGYLDVGNCYLKGIEPVRYSQVLRSDIRTGIETVLEGGNGIPTLKRAAVRIRKLHLSLHTA